MKNKDQLIKELKEADQAWREAYQAWREAYQALEEYELMHNDT